MTHRKCEITPRTVAPHVVTPRAVPSALTPPHSLSLYLQSRSEATGCKSECEAFLRPAFLGNHFGKPKLKPRPLLPRPCPAQPVSVVPATPLPAGMPILVIYNRFIELILRGIKTVEMRPKPSHKHMGKRIALCVSGGREFPHLRSQDKGGYLVLGTAVFACQTERSRYEADAWKGWVQQAACVGGDWPAEYRWLYHLTDVQAFTRPVYFSTPLGEDGLRKHPGQDWRSFDTSWVSRCREW